MSDPPKKQGGMRSFVAVACGIPLLGPIRVAHVLIYPCGKAYEQPPWAALKARRRSYEMARDRPFPLALHCAGSVLAVKGPLRRFAPWTAPGRSEGMAVYEGKGGMQIKPVIYLI